MKIPVFYLRQPKTRLLRTATQSAPNEINNNVKIVDPAYRGKTHSGRSIALSGDGYIDVPITDTSYITYFDVNQHQFVVPSLSGDTFRLENVTFNSLVVLDNKSFTQDDLDLINNDPELLVRWGLGEDVGFSIGVKQANDKYYPCTEDDQNDFLLEIGYSEGNEVGVLTDCTDTVINGTVVNENGSIHLISDGSSSYCYCSNSNKKFNTIANKQYILTVSCKLISANGWNVYNQSIDNHLIGGSWNDQYQISGTRSNLFTAAGNEVIRLYAWGVNGDKYDGVYTKLSIKEILSDYLPINGTYSRAYNSQYGLQALRLELNDANVPIGILSGEVLIVGDSYIDTQWNPDFAAYTIEMSVEYEDGSKHYCKYVNDNGVHSLYIDGIQEPVTPLLPTQTFKLTNKVVGSNIKYKKLLAPVRVWKKVI